MAPGAARQLWSLFEPVHAVVYFAEEARAAAQQVGYRGFWMGYFGFRMAPLGAIGPDVAVSACFGFHPSRAHRALPDAWDFAAPPVALQARLDGSTAALTRIAAAAPGVAETVGEAADLAWAAAAHADTAGRVLGAANQALPRPSNPFGALWQACTTLREHRGDGHNAVLIASGVGPVDAHWLKVAGAESDPETLRVSRNFADEEWDGAAARLAELGWLDAERRLTDLGRATHGQVEELTDNAALLPWARLGAEQTERLAGLLHPIAEAVIASGTLVYPNPIGVPRPFVGD
jgi:helix-turn-helix protein